ncbi:MAG: DUF3768 domain-containing protein [Rickettsiales bacterium]|jgi:hypothetical protein|nr:DUF3768 domain-containing protein [Rickettsiales bacterium]
MNTAKIRELNDKLRHNLFSPNGHGKVILTASVSAMPHQDLFALLCLVGCFEDFNESNDPYQEHEFGALDFKKTRYFFKIDYYAPDLLSGSIDPSDPKQTCRVLTIMRAEEY